MTEGSNDQDAGKGRLSLRPAGRLELGRTVDAGSVRQSFSHGRTKVVQVEVRKKRVGAPGVAPQAAPVSLAPAANPASGTAGPAVPLPPVARPAPGAGRTGGMPRALTATELAARQRALVEQQKDNAKRDAERREQEKISILSAAEEAHRRDDDARRLAEEEARRAAEEAREARDAAARAPAPVEETAQPEPVNGEAVAAPVVAQPAVTQPAAPTAKPAPRPVPGTPGETLRLRPVRPEDEDENRARRPGAAMPPRKPV